MEFIVAYFGFFAQVEMPFSLMITQVHFCNLTKLADTVCRNFFQIWAPNCNTGESVFVHKHNVATVRIEIHRVQNNDGSFERQSGIASSSVASQQYRISVVMLKSSY
jgi:hypothetical protein